MPHTFFEVWDENVPKLMWRGRWACQRTLEHYVQELVAHQVLNNVSVVEDTRITQLAALYIELLDEVSV